MFHSLPPSCEREIKSALAVEASQRPPVPGRLEGLMPLGRGTALKLSSPEMITIWDILSERFYGLVTPQDEHPPRLHATIQNKVSPQEAKALQAELGPMIEARDFRFAGLSLHIYRDGPWEFVRTYPFRGR